MNEWIEHKLIDLCVKIGSGATPRGGGESYKETGISLIRSQNVLDFQFSESGLAFIDNEQAHELKNVIVKENDVLLNITGDSVARVCKVPIKVLPARVNQHVAIVRSDSQKLNSDFLLYYLQSIKDRLLSISEIGATRRALTKGMIENLKIIVPDFREQTSIASILSSLDDKIDLLHRQNKTLEQMAETLFRQWFVVEAEEDWEEGMLGDVIEIFDNKRVPLSKMQRDKMKDGKMYPYYGAAKIMDYVNDFIFDGEYILMGEDGTVKTEEGYPILQYATGKFWVNNHTHVITAKEPYNNFFILNYLSKKNIENIVTGAVQPKINQANLKSLSFPVYPASKVIAFNEVTSSVFSKIKLNNNQIETLSNLRDTLLPKLISGEIKLTI
ncbi:MAG: restriction endonuclease subunit S [Bacteroidales bacterium]|jgi:type I restriction enzyme S subunit|nr:restriction endonuclease subunit S [Bacteroidales bacterium]